ncbi:MAG: hypothetical protein JSS53_07455 [Proteobacteria bacterium]|nr:hypothetical protein [Pseudomonadota bacterium]
MKTKKSPNKQSMLSVAYEIARGLYKAGVINAITMRDFGDKCERKPRFTR